MARRAAPGQLPCRRRDAAGARRDILDGHLLFMALRIGDERAGRSPCVMMAFGASPVTVGAARRARAPC